MTLALLALCLSPGADYGNGPVTPLAGAPVAAAAPAAAPDFPLQTEAYAVVSVDTTPAGRFVWARVEVSEPGFQNRTLFVLDRAAVFADGRRLAKPADLAAWARGRSGVRVVVEVDPARYGEIVTARFVAPAKAAAAAATVRTGYPVHPTRWTYPGEIHAHLQTGEHRGKWPAVWVRGLTTAEAESLHDDDHEGHVKWEYVPGRSPAAQAPPAVPPAARTQAPPVALRPQPFAFPRLGVGSFCPPGST